MRMSDLAVDWLSINIDCGARESSSQAEAQVCMRWLSSIPILYVLWPNMQSKNRCTQEGQQ